MWYLINATNPEQKYVLLADTEYVVGRRDCQILVCGDAAVSRKHAVIQLSHPEAWVSHPHKFSLVTLKDVSKFGTWVNKDRLKGETSIKDGDEIYFGSPKSTFLLVNEPYIVTTSCLENVSKRRVKNIAHTLGGHVVNEWLKDCSLLVMNHISVTIKVICAMVSLKAVVTPKYLEDLIIYLKGEGPEPDTQKYLPPVAESQVNPDNVSFGADARRTTLFQGMKFIFLSQKQFKKMSLAIELAGGVPVLMEEGTDDNNDDVLTEDGTVVMNCGPEEQQMLTENGKKWLQHVYAYLKMKKKYLIQDSEIGYAVLYSSTERHCNPNINTAQHLMPIPSQSLSERIVDPMELDVLVENTEISQQTTKKERGHRKPLIAGNQETLVASTVKTEPISQDMGTPLHGTKRSVSSSVCEVSDGQKIKQEKETMSCSRSLSSKSPSPGPGDASLRVCQRSPRSPSPQKTKQNIPEMSARNTKSPTLRTSTAKVIAEKDTVSGSTFGNKWKTNLDIVDDSDEKDNGLTSSRSTRKHNILGIFDDSDDEDTGPASSRKVAAAKSKRKCADFDPFEESDDGDTASSRPAAVFTKPIATTKRKHEDSENDDETFLQGTGRNKKKCTDLVEDSEFSVKMQQNPVFPATSVTVKQEKNDKHEVISTVGSQSHLVCDSEIPMSNRSPRKDVKQEPVVRRVEIDESGTIATKREVPGVGVDHSVSQITESCPVVNGDVPFGFLTTRKPIKHQVVKSDMYEKEPDLPESIVVTVFIDLVKRPVQPQSRDSGKDVPDGFVRWKGKLVKNFKKFKKISNMGSDCLPNIIGGSDLVIHTGSQRRDLDDWCKEALQAESQQNERDKEAQDLFNWEPSTTRRKNSR